MAVGEKGAISPGATFNASHPLPRGCGTILHLKWVLRPWSNHLFCRTVAWRIIAERIIKSASKWLSAVARVILYDYEVSDLSVCNY